MTEVPSSKAGRRARLLVVDDESSVRAGLQDFLSMIGYHVEEAASGREALKLLKSASYDLMVLDIRMPGMSGIEVMQHTRKIYPDLPIIVLTAHASVESAIAAVKSEAVDYMLKPFDAEDLAAAIAQTLQERAERLRHQHLLDLIGETLNTLDEKESSTPLPLTPTTSPERFLIVGSVTLDRQKRLLVMQGDPPRTVELSDSEMDILAALMERPHQVLSCSQLVQAAMGYEVDEYEAQNQVRLYIHRLRRKIEANPNTPRLICTVRGRGYFFSPD
jgi:DNA-binding response OmpR family regulator